MGKQSESLKSPLGGSEAALWTGTGASEFVIWNHQRALKSLVRDVSRLLTRAALVYDAGPTCVDVGQPSTCLEGLGGE